MADDVTLPGVGVVVATDDIGSGRQVQLVKPVYGADGSATMVSAASPLPVAPQSLILSAAGTSATTIIGPQDVTGYASWSYAVTGTFSAGHTVEGSLDGSTWQSYSYASHGTNVATASFYQSTISSNGTNGGTVVWSGMTAPFKYIRVRVSSYTSGTVNAVLTLSPSLAGTVPVYVTGGSVNAGTTTTSPTDANSMGYWGVVGATINGFNGTSFDRHRLSRIFKSATATASGNTAVWTPTTGKRFQLLSVRLVATANVAQSTGGVITVKLQDNTTDIGIAVPVFVPGTAGTAFGDYALPPIDLGPYGFRSAAINQALNVNLSAALTSGSIGVIAMGTEE